MCVGVCGKGGQVCTQHRVERFTLKGSFLKVFGDTFVEQEVPPCEHCTCQKLLESSLLIRNLMRAALAQPCLERCWGPGLGEG